MNSVLLTFDTHF